MEGGWTEWRVPLQSWQSLGVEAGGQLGGLVFPPQRGGCFSGATSVSFPGSLVYP